jgi:hypothetical protein
MTLGSERDKTAGVTRPHERRARGFERPVAAVHAHLREAAARHGFAEPEVLMRWTEIVGERLAGFCVPVKVSYARARDLGATLYVRAEGARAVEVEHLGPRILERVNQFYGYRAVHRLRVTQTIGAAGFAEPPAVPFGPPDPSLDAGGPRPDADRDARAAELTSGIRTPELRATLSRMAARVIGRVLARDDAAGPPSRRTEPHS